MAAAAAVSHLGHGEYDRRVDGAVPRARLANGHAQQLFHPHAMRLLKDKFPQIVDAVDAGGSGDPYAGLNAEGWRCAGDPDGFP
jgi:hypothetical protein